MLTPIRMNIFKRDVKRLKKRGKDMDLMKHLIIDLINETPLDPKYQDHPLTGNYKGNRECHIEPDWLLVYSVVGDDLTLVRTGTHSDLFE